MVAISGITALCLLGDSMLYIALPLHWKEAGLSAWWEVGLLLSVNRLVRLPLNPLVGWVYQRISLRLGLTAALILSGITTLGYGVAQGLTLWILLRVLWGFAWSLLRIGGMTAVLHASKDEHRGEMIGLYNGLYRMGSLVGMLLGGLLAASVGLSGVSLLFGALSLIGLFILPLLPGRGKSPRANTGRAGGVLGGFFREGALFILGFGGLVTLMFQGVVTSTLSWLVQRFGSEVTLWGVVLAATGWSGLIQSLRWIWEPFLATRIGRWSDGPRGRLPWIRASLLAAATGLALLPLAHPFPLWLGVALFTLLTATALTTLTDASAGDWARRGDSVASITLYTLVQDLGAALGPVFAYVMIGLPIGMTGVYLVGALAFLSLAFLPAPGRKRLLQTESSDRRPNLESK